MTATAAVSARHRVEDSAQPRLVVGVKRRSPGSRRRAMIRAAAAVTGNSCAGDPSLEGPEQWPANSHAASRSPIARCRSAKSRAWLDRACSSCSATADNDPAHPRHSQCAALDVALPEQRSDLRPPQVDAIRARRIQLERLSISWSARSHSPRANRGSRVFTARIAPEVRSTPAGAAIASPPSAIATASARRPSMKSPSERLM